MKTIWEYIKEVIAGFGISGAFASVWPELIHGVSVVITGVVCTITVHWTRTKYLPLADKHGYLRALKLVFKQ